MVGRLPGARNDRQGVRLARSGGPLNDGKPCARGRKINGGSLLVSQSGGASVPCHDLARGALGADDGQGRGGWCFNSQGMYRGLARADQPHIVAMYGEE